jgi:hypothetical protein
VTKTFKIGKEELGKRKEGIGKRIRETTDKHGYF